ncbi:sugar phosphate isomerase/epimerase family protein [Botrimarina mediterranea]|uniref:Xylose isomerase-like TIM barrel n=1 Tax=Botrimarina mediterranea TaxID=2528022 RepID=A0A518K9K5_9BACT|nr:sugar phosphate isomerase/epimerase family protein [Botrimarina mediterranea]QDV74475.1 Xylose isomerase-like TIM barrel [Botrimarina mediterranea]QDV79071.1 Xylose isomerase-like TIM barrel [Planctomycetes bacterium K2D]
MSLPPILLSGFADETSSTKLAGEQLAAMAALGLRRCTLRFVDLGDGVKNVMALTKREVTQLSKLLADFGLEVATLGSPIGKVKLQDVEDGTANKYVSFDKYLKQDVSKACDLAASLGTKLVRGFSFYHPKGTDPAEHLPQVVDQLGQIAEACAAAGLVFGLEVEANLVGQTGQLLKKVHKQVNHPAMVLIYDAGNLLTQGYSPDECFAEYEAMKPGLGWIHVKDYRPLQTSSRGGHIDEEALCEYRPVGRGSGVYERVLRDLIEGGATPVLKRMKKIGLPGVLLDLEPHVKGGGQFGGYSGADGMGIALRSLTDLLDYLGLSHDLKTADNLS